MPLDPKLEKRIDDGQKWMVDLLVDICRIPALDPANGGDGEWKKADRILSLIKDIPFDKVEVLQSPDPEADRGSRPNIVAMTKGEGPKLWLVSHVDIVPPGDYDLWETDPYEPVVKGDKLVGRGVEDNGQAIATTLYATKCVLEEHGHTKLPVALALVADEETKSLHGIEFLIKSGLIKQGDFLIVPDSGTPEGDYIEVAEKSSLAVRVRTTGKQVHASRPHKGKNAYREASRFLIELDEELHTRFGKNDPLYMPPVSTFEPTKKEPNVPNVNTVPGEDAFFIDSRILPDFKVDDILAVMRAKAAEFAPKHGVRIEFDVISKGDAPKPTSVDSPVVRMLAAAIKDTRGLTAKPMGIGGGTCAAYFRKAGYDSAVWATIEETAHEPNEFVYLRNLPKDAKVFAHLMPQ